MPNLRQISFSNVRIAKRTGYVGGIRLQMRKMPVLITGRLVRFSVRVHLSISIVTTGYLGMCYVWYGKFDFYCFILVSELYLATSLRVHDV